MICTGNLLHRWDKQKQRKEVFTYDGLDRLASAQVHTTNASGGIVQSNPAISYTYDGSVGGTTKGNLATRTDIGKFSTDGYHRITGAMGANFPIPYNDPPIEPVQGFLENGSTRLFSVQAKPKNDGVAVPTGSFFGEAWTEKRPGAASEEILDRLFTITAGPQAIAYTSYHQPASISGSVNGTPYLLEYTYDSDQQRNYSKLRNMNNVGTPLEERWYQHGLETVRQGGSTSNTYKALYVEGGDGLCAIIAVGPTTTLTPYAVYKDHLGSIVTVNKPTGGGNSQIYVEQNYDAWGRPILLRERLRSCPLYPLGRTSARAKGARASWWVSVRSTGAVPAGGGLPGGHSADS